MSYLICNNNCGKRKRNTHVKLNNKVLKVFKTKRVISKKAEKMFYTKRHLLDEESIKVEVLLLNMNME